MKTSTVILTIGLCGICACQHMDPKTKMEDAQSKANRAIHAADYDTFVRYTAFQTVTVDRKEFQRVCADKAARDLLIGDVFIDLRKKANFLTLKSVSGWAAYYAETDLDDPQYITVTVFLFKEEGRTWKACGGIFGLTKARPDSERAKRGMAAWKGRDDMLNVINTAPEFNINMLIKKKTEAAQQSF